MKVYYSGSPENHHLIKKVLDYDNFINEDKSYYIRFDNHPDNSKPKGFSICKPCAMYMNEVEKHLNSYLWVQKTHSEETPFHIHSYESNPESPEFLNDLRKRVHKFNNLEESLEFISDNSLNKIIVDIDPDIVEEYSTRFKTGGMTWSELKNCVNYLRDEKTVDLLFLAGGEEDAETLGLESELTQVK